MKIKIEIDENLAESEIIIRSNKLDEEVLSIQKKLASRDMSTIKVLQNEKEVYLKLSEILFFESDSRNMIAHTKKDSFTVKSKLYELEGVLPLSFIRVSKSTILNVDNVYSVSKNITSSSLIEFKNSFKKVYVSRNYYKVFKDRLDDRRNYHEK